MRAKNARRLKLIEYARAKRWTAVRDALLGTAADKVPAVKLGKSRSAVRSRRAKLGVPSG